MGGCSRHEIKVLDHGFIALIDAMPRLVPQGQTADAAIVQAARVSYGKGTRKISEDRGLIHYLLRHRHTTPFEMCEIKFHVKLPIFVARQWIRHRTANVNEYSARYSVLDEEFYVPAPEHLAAQSQINKQGRDDALPAAEAAEILAAIKNEGSRAYGTYTKLLNETATGEVIDEKRSGIARELARMVLPANIYSQWYWKIDLHNLLHFLSLRADPHAQYEIRVYAEAMLDVVKRWVPITYEAFMQHRLKSVTLSAAAWDVVKRMLAGEDIAEAQSGLGKREWRELMAVLGRST
ncbi:MAG TPA: FAD-dependent thymidylate synthase [Verrucomicrobiae bacterium]|nr:FAD-dependent thymidylate synthase [Verrucomicrobiae bacterium]